jgi:hypothetical protein
MQTMLFIASYSKQTYAIVANLTAKERLSREPLVELATLQDHVKEKVLNVFPAAH